MQEKKEKLLEDKEVSKDIEQNIAWWKQLFSDCADIKMQGDVSGKTDGCESIFKLYRDYRWQRYAAGIRTGKNVIPIEGNVFRRTGQRFTEKCPWYVGCDTRFLPYWMLPMEC